MSSWHPIGIDSVSSYPENIFPVEWQQTKSDRISKWTFASRTHVVFHFRKDMSFPSDKACYIYPCCKKDLTLAQTPSLCERHEHRVLFTQMLTQIYNNININNNTKLNQPPCRRDNVFPVSPGSRLLPAVGTKFSTHYSGGKTDPTD